MEAASMGIPAMAISLETETQYHLSHSEDIDFSTAGYFAAYFARLILKNKLPQGGVDLIKVEVPSHATPETGWEVGGLSHSRYYDPVPPTRTSWEEPGFIWYRHSDDINQDPVGTDAYIMRTKKMVAVTPLNLDMTARVKFNEFEDFLRK
jgi:5'-nucleotidase